jgi:hypothetical protein
MSDLVVGLVLGLGVVFPLVVFIITVIYYYYFPANYRKTRYVHQNPNELSISANQVLYGKQNPEIPYSNANFTKGLYKVPSGFSVIIPKNSYATGVFRKAVILGSRKKNGAARRTTRQHELLIPNNHNILSTPPLKNRQRSNGITSTRRTRRPTKRPTTGTKGITALNGK